MKAEFRRHELVASAISVFEIITLERRGRLEFKVPATERLANLRKLPELTIQPITDEIAEHGGGLGEVFPGDPADRLIAATSLVLGVPLITQGTKLRGVPSLSTVLVAPGSPCPLLEEKGVAQRIVSLMPPPMTCMSKRSPVWARWGD